MNTPVKAPVLALLLVGVLAPHGATAQASGAAQASDARAREVMEEVDRRTRGWGDMEAELLMEIHRGDDVWRRLLDVRLMEADGEDRTLLVLREPADLAGTAFLSIRAANGERSQWIYLPSRRRSRRISGTQASDPFLGSDFTYGDLDPPSLAGYDFRLLREVDVEGVPGVVIERTDREEPDGPRERLWVDTRDFRLHRVEYLDGGGALDRTLVLDAYEVVDGFARPGRLEMREEGGDDRTVLVWSDIRIGVGLTDRDFDPGRMGG